MYKLVLIRHGESIWNKANKFTGWKDVELSENGLQEAQNAAQLLKNEGFEFDVAYTSVLKRAIKTLWTVLENLDMMWVPVNRRWRLNERHYGALQGLNKSETAQKYGDEQVFTWRRSYATPPPEMSTDDNTHPVNDRRYNDIDPALLPSCEALKHCKDRVMPVWEEEIAPMIKTGKRVIIAAHGNSLRALIKHLDEVSEEEITTINVPTAIPLVYELDENLKTIKSYYLGDQEAARKSAEAVANQSKQ